jgi:hypothetical protein
VTARTRGRAVLSSPKPFPLVARGCIPMHGSATGAVIQPMPPSAMVSMNGRAMMIEMADARSTATLAKEPGQRSARTSVRSEASTSGTSICMWPPMQP